MLRFGVLGAGSPAANVFQAAVIHQLLALGDVEFAGDVSGDLDAIARKNLDILLDFSEQPLTGLILTIPVHGVWTFVHRVDRRRNISVASLVRVCDPEGWAIPLASCVVRAEPQSLQKNRATAMLAAADLPTSVCKRLLSGQSPGSSTPAQPGLFTSGAAPRWRQPFASIGVGLRWATSQLEALLFMETWNVGVVNAPIERFLEPGFRPAITWLPPVGPHKFIADPFVADTGSGIELVVEEFDYDRSQGYICSAKLAREGEPDWTVRIDDGVHMSYPFPVQSAGRWYVAPESSLHREVALYLCDPASGRWKKAKTLIEDFAALDSTFVEYGGQWWMFCACLDESPNSKLYLWHAPELLGPWRPHRMNPVKSDIRSSRPGGTPFWHQGSLYRPAQDSSVSYGGALCINRITCLTPDEFQEELVVQLKPSGDSPYPDGFHTLSAIGSITVVDGKRMAFIPTLSARRLRHKLGRLVGLSFARPVSR